MYNPLLLLNQTTLDKMITAGEIYFVRQDYERGMSPFDKEQKASLIFTPYKTVEEAELHYRSLSDKHRKIYNAKNEEDYAKLKKAASQPKGYSSYINLIQLDYDLHISDQLKKRIRYYVKNILGWYPSKDEGFDITFFLKYGVLFAELAFRQKKKQVKFDEIEKII